SRFAVSQARLAPRAGLCLRTRADLLLLAFAAALAGSIAGVTLGLLLGLERGQASGFLFLFTGELGGGKCCGLGLTRLLLGLGGLAGFPDLGARGGLRLTLRLTLLDLGIVRS